MGVRATWEKIGAGSRNIGFEDFARVVEAFGFVHRRTSGSHHVYRHPSVPRPLSLQSRKGQAKPYQVAQFLSMVEQYGLKLKSD
jgi:hypothetical protein